MENEMKIVLAEDELITALDIKQHLKKEFNAEVYTTAKGDEIENLTRNHKPDLIISDIQLKGTTNGIEAIKKLKNNINIPVIFISAYTMAFYLDQINKIPDSFVLPKPINYNLFYSLIKSLVK